MINTKSDIMRQQQLETRRNTTTGTYGRRRGYGTTVLYDNMIGGR